MAIPKEVLDALMKDYKGPENITGPDGLLKELSKALIERAMQAEMTEQIGYEKNDPEKKSTSNCRNETVKQKKRCERIKVLWKSRSPEIAKACLNQKSLQSISVSIKDLTIKSS